MKNLVIYQVTPLETEETFSINGGTGFTIWFMSKAAIFCAGFKEGWNESKRK